MAASRPQHIETSHNRTASTSSAASSPPAGPSSPRVAHPAAFSSLFPQFHHMMPDSQVQQLASLDQLLLDDEAQPLAEGEASDAAMGTNGEQLSGYPFPTAPDVRPEVSLELRLRWLEALVLGSGPSSSAPYGQALPSRLSAFLAPRPHGYALTKEAEEIESRLAAICKDNLLLKRFLSCYDLYAPLLPPPEDQPEPPEALSPAEAAAYFTEAEADVRSADRDMSDIRELERKGVMNPGRLAEHEPLKPRLSAVLQRHSTNRQKFVSLESRITALLQAYSSQIDALSERFVEWNEFITEAEAEIALLEKKKAERAVKGFS